jgi:hypothetical protein
MEVASFRMFSQSAKHVKVPKGAKSRLCVWWGGVQKWLWEQDIIYNQGLENLVIWYDKCLKKFGNNVEK